MHYVRVKNPWSMGNCIRGICMNSKMLSLAMALLLITLAVLAITQHPSEREERVGVKSWAFQLQDADPKEIAGSGLDIVVMDYSRDGGENGEYSRDEVESIKNAGVVPIAYLSIGEAEDYRFYWKEEWERDPPAWLGKENPEWKGNYAVRYWDEGWVSIIHEYLDRIISLGFSGVYLDKVDEFEYWADPENGEGHYLNENESAERMLELIEDIATYSRNKAGDDFLIIPQNGERILKYDDGSILDVVSGWGVEDIFYNGTQLWSEDEWEHIVEERMPYLKMVLSSGKPVLSVEYVDDGSGYVGKNRERIDDYREKALSMGYIPYAAVSDRGLDELNIIEGVQP